ncbi:hypothetical protein ACIBU0_33600 [Streptomyces sp. NPDC049627]|uniref:hypothetical protein n=1 Tax=Streptomyces sp. NPDC049627 TaxID=3365595 RepID=UPI0037B9B6FA
MGSSVKAGIVALRLVLLAVLLLGVGVVHTLSHAGVHEGVAASVVSGAVPTSHQTHAAPEEGGIPEAVADAASFVERDDSPHAAHEGHTTVAECFALIPSGPWLLAPSGSAMRGVDASAEAFRGALPPDFIPDFKPSRSSVLRI